MNGTHLYLVGDDDALDTLAELCRYLPLFELARVDDVPDVLPADSIVVIGAMHPRQRDSWLSRAHAQTVRHVMVVPALPGGEQAGARAVVAAAELVRLLIPALDQS